MDFDIFNASLRALAAFGTQERPFWYGRGNCVFRLALACGVGGKYGLLQSPRSSLGAQSSDGNRSSINSSAGVLNQLRCTGLRCSLRSVQSQIAYSPSALPHFTVTMERQWTLRLCWHRYKYITLFSYVGIVFDLHSP